MSAFGWAALGILFCSSVASATGLDDANAGLAALNAGDYDRAITLMTRALASGDLHGDDRELGLACRGRAYLKKADYGSAIVDLDQARRAKPDDMDAQKDLESALAALVPVASIPGAPRIVAGSPPQQGTKPNFWTGLRDALVSGAAAGVQQGLQNAAQDPQNPN